MKKLILMALVAVAAAIYQPAQAQVSLSVNIGAQPRYGFYNDYYARPVVHRTYYAPAPRVVYVKQYNNNNRRYYAPGRRVVSRSYNRPSTRYYNVKQVHYKNNKHAYKHGKGHGKGRR
jgi:hypothetical protein